MAIKYEIWVSEEFANDFEGQLLQGFIEYPKSLLSYLATDERPDEEVDEHFD